MNSKFLVFTCIFAIIFAACAFSCVNAASVNVPESTKAGDTITVTFDFGEAAVNGEFHVTYDASVLKLVTETPNLPGATKYADSTDGNVGWVFAGSNAQAVSSVSLQFEVIGEAGKTATVTFVPERFKNTENAKIDLQANYSQELTVAPADQGGDNTPTNPPAEENSTDNKDTNTKTPTKYPQTGVNVAYVACGIALVLAAGYIAVKKH